LIKESGNGDYHGAGYGQASNKKKSLTVSRKSYYRKNRGQQRVQEGLPDSGRAGVPMAEERKRRKVMDLFDSALL